MAQTLPPTNTRLHSCLTKTERLSLWGHSSGFCVLELSCHLQTIRNNSTSLVFDEHVHCKLLLVFWEQYSNIPPLTNSNFCICGLACEQHADNLLCLCWFAALANHIWIDVSAQMRQYVLLICFYDNRDLRHGGYIRLWLHRHNLLVAGAPLAFISISWDPLVIMKIF